MSFFRLGVDSSTAIDIYPDKSFAEKEKQVVSQHRNKNGSYKRYIWGSFTGFSFGLNYVSISDTNQINEWYDNNTVLTLFEDVLPSSNKFILNISKLNIGKVSHDTDHTGLVLTNKSSPMDRHAPPYDTLYKGKLKLEGGFS